MKINSMTLVLLIHYHAEISKYTHGYRFCLKNDITLGLPVCGVCRFTSLSGKKLYLRHYSALCQLSYIQNDKIFSSSPLRNSLGPLLRSRKDLAIP